MHIQKLPDYSCERYYLLSEIEQRAEFVFIDEASSKAKERTSTQNPRIDSIYLLWDAENHWSNLKQNLEKIMVKYPSCESRCIIIVECLIKDEKTFDTIVNAQVNELLEWTSEKYPESFMFVGVSDQVSGTPGLEKLEDFMKFLVTSAPGVSGNIRLIGVTRQDCLGHDPNREPDGGSGVYQILCCSSIDQYIRWETQVREYIQQLYGVQDSTNNPINTLTNPETTAFKITTILPFTVLLTIIVIIVGIIMQYIQK